MKFTTFCATQSADAEIDAGHGHEAEHHGRGLRDLAAIGPLHPLQLGPARLQEGDRATEQRASGRGRSTGGLALGRTTLTWGLAERGGRGLLALARELVLVDGELAAVGHLAGELGAVRELEVELVDVTDVPDRLGDRGSRLEPAVGRRDRPAPGGDEVVCGPWPRHASRLARLPVAGVLTAPAAVFAQRDAIRVVALALIRLVVATLAVLAREGDRNSHVSAGHLAPRGVMVVNGAGRRKTPPRREVRGSLARVRRARATARPPRRVR